MQATKAAQAQSTAPGQEAESPPLRNTRHDLNPLSSPPRFDRAMRQIIKDRWTDRDFLIDKLEHYERSIQSGILKEKESAHPDQNLIQALSERLEIIAEAKITIFARVSLSTKAQAFNAVFPDAIKRQDVCIQNVLDGTYTVEDLEYLQNLAYPAPSDVKGLLYTSLKEIFLENGEANLTPDARVTYETFTHSTLDNGFHSDGIKQETLLRLALGSIQKALWNDHIEVKNLPSSIARLYQRARHWGNYNFPITRLLHEKVDALTSRLQDAASTEARQVLWQGKIFAAIIHYFDKHPEKFELRNAFSHHNGVFLLKFDLGAGSVSIDNLIAIRESETNYVLIDCNSQDSFTFSTGPADGGPTHGVFKKLILDNIDLKRSLYAARKADMEYMFANQKSTVRKSAAEYRLRYGLMLPRPEQPASYPRPGKLSFEHENVSIGTAAAALTQLEIETLKKNAAFIIIDESEARESALAHHVDDALKKLATAASLPMLGWSPAILAPSLAIAAPAIGYAMRRAAAKDDIDRADARATFYADLQTLVLYSAMAAGGVTGLSAVSRVVKNRRPPKAMLKAILTNKHPSDRHRVKAFPGQDAPPGSSGNKSGRDGVLSGYPQHAARPINPPDNALKRLSPDKEIIISPASVDRHWQLSVAGTLREEFLGKNTLFNIVQQKRIDGMTYQSGYINVHGWQLHGVRTAQSTLENNGASQLLIAAHGSHIFNTQGLPAKISYAPSGLFLEFAASYGMNLRIPGFAKIYSSIPDIAPRAVVRAGPHAVVRARPNDHAQHMKDFAWFDATGAVPKPNTVPDLKAVPFHDLRLFPFEKDTQFLIHTSLEKQFGRTGPGLADILVIRQGHQSNLGDILKLLPLENKYAKVSVVACRALRGDSKGIVDIPDGPKQELFRRLGSEMGFSQSALDKMQKTYVARTMEGVSFPKTAFELLLTRDLLFQSRSPRAAGGARREQSRQPEELYYFFDLIGIVSSIDIDLADQTMSEKPLRYIISDATGEPYLVPIDAAGIIQPKLAKVL